MRKSLPVFIHNCWCLNKCDCWASEPTWVVGRLDNNSIIKINSYLHKYLSESDDLWINPTPLDERDPIKISVSINKLTHMEFGPSCQFNTITLVFHFPYSFWILLLTVFMWMRWYIVIYLGFSSSAECIAQTFILISSFVRCIIGLAYIHNLLFCQFCLRVLLCWWI